MLVLLSVLTVYLGVGIIVAGSPLTRSAIDGPYWPSVATGTRRWRVVVSLVAANAAMLAAWPVLLPAAMASLLSLDRIGLGAALRLVLTSYRLRRRKPLTPEPRSLAGIRVTPMWLFEGRAPHDKAEEARLQTIVASMLKDLRARRAANKEPEA